jgi:flagellum-specific peptidoglycan hydrolase FlgJ
MGNTIDFSQRGSEGNTLDFSNRVTEPSSIVTKPETPVHSGPFSSKADFINAIKPLAKELSKDLGIDERIIIAQSAVETGWGSKVKGNSFFGIKAHGGDGIEFTTHEVVDGKRIKMKDTFKAYDSLADSVQGYGAFLRENPRYKPFLAATTLEEQIAALGRSGYATDPNYAKMVRSIAKGKTLKELGGY